jgi:hypothetical protein
MATGGFMSYLEEADSPLELARRLGSACLEHESELAEMLGQPRTREEIERLELWTGQVSLATWEAIVADPTEFEQRFGAKVMAGMRRARTRHPMDLLGVLRGLCRRPLAEFFAVVVDQVNLDRGLPVPFATRPLPDMLGSDCTTSLGTLNNTSLLEPLPFDLYGPSATSQVRVVLDFSHRDRIDELTWGEKGLPLIATVHPKSGGDYEVETIDTAAETFFGVHPREVDLEEIEALLEQANRASAPIAVLPELSLAEPDQLEPLLDRRGDELPPIIVAGSAHYVVGGSAGNEIRANESRVYLDGRFVAMARKYHAFKTDELGVETGEELFSEDISREQKTIMVLSGRYTRLAVVICADLIGKRIPSLLVDAGVNLLLAPAMSPEIGSFGTALGDVAGYCQGVGAVANIRWSDSGEPFLCMCAVPQEEPTKQIAALTGDGKNPAPTLAVLDPNKPLPAAVEWLRLPNLDDR